MHGRDLGTSAVEQKRHNMGQPSLQVLPHFGPIIISSWSSRATPYTIHDEFPLSFKSSGGTLKRQYVIWKGKYPVYPITPFPCWIRTLAWNRRGTHHGFIQITPGACHLHHVSTEINGLLGLMEMEGYTVRRWSILPHSDPTLQAGLEWSYATSKS